MSNGKITVSGPPITEFVSGIMACSDKILIFIKPEIMKKYYPGKTIVEGFAVCAEEELTPEK